VLQAVLGDEQLRSVKQVAEMMIDRRIQCVSENPPN
jgi:hypothetical protein